MNSRKKAQKTHKRLNGDKWGVARPSELEGSRFAVWQFYRPAAGGSRERLQRLPSTIDGSLLSQRDLRTKPGVSTPGTCPKSCPPQRGGRRGIAQDQPKERNFRAIIYRPYRAVRHMVLTPGLKPRAQSFNPFEIAHSPSRIRKKNHFCSPAFLRLLRLFAAIPLHSYTRLTNIQFLL
jgi:hypothetical protein